MKKTIVFVVFGLILLVSSAGTPASNSSFDNKESIKVGVTVCLTGKCADWGNYALKGAQLAVEEINNAGGVLGRKIELLVEDSREESPTGVISAYRLLKSRDVKFIVGPSWTTAAQALAPIAFKDKERIFISPTVGVKDYNEASSNIFNLWPHDEVSTKKLAAFAISKTWKRAGIFSSQQPWEEHQGRVFRNEFIRLGGEVTAHEEPLSGSRDLKVEALKIVKSKPDVIFISNLTALGVAALELEKLHYKGEKIVISSDDTNLRVADGALDGSYIPMHPESSEKFKKAFMKKYGGKPGNGADTAYDSIYLLQKALTEVGTTNALSLASEMLRTKFKGASGDLVLDDKGGVVREPQLYKIKNSNFEKSSWG